MRTYVQKQYPQKANREKELVWFPFAKYMNKDQKETVHKDIQKGSSSIIFNNINFKKIFFTYKTNI